MSFLGRGGVPWPCFCCPPRGLNLLVFGLWQAFPCHDIHRSCGLQHQYPTHEYTQPTYIPTTPTTHSPHPPTMTTKRRRGRPSNAELAARAAAAASASSTPEEEEDAPPVLAPAEAETAMVVALINGGRLGWGKPRDEPWWPCIAARSYGLLHHFTSTDPSSRVAPPRTGQVLAYFLGEDTYDILDEAWFEVGFPLRRPQKTQLAARPEYAEGVGMGERLQARLDALDEKEEHKLRVALSKGAGRMVQVYVEKGGQGKADEEEEEVERGVHAQHLVAGRGL